MEGTAFRPSQMEQNTMMLIVVCLAGLAVLTIGVIAFVRR